jgi:hypothetical protein
MDVHEKNSLKTSLGGQCKALRLSRFSFFIQHIFVCSALAQKCFLKCSIRLDWRSLSISFSVFFLLFKFHRKNSFLQFVPRHCACQCILPFFLHSLLYFDNFFSGVFFPFFGKIFLASIEFPRVLRRCAPVLDMICE